MSALSESRIREIIREELRPVLNAVLPEQGHEISVVVDGDVFTGHAKTGLGARADQVKESREAPTRVSIGEVREILRTPLTSEGLADRINFLRDQADRFPEESDVSRRRFERIRVVADELLQLLGLQEGVELLVKFSTGHGGSSPSNGDAPIVGGV